jgi:hypothetical protein
VLLRGDAVSTVGFILVILFCILLMIAVLIGPGDKP